jgi:hypothetical protein
MRSCLRCEEGSKKGEEIVRNGRKPGSRKEMVVEAASCVIALFDVCTGRSEYTLRAEMRPRIAGAKHGSGLPAVNVLCGRKEVVVVESGVDWTAGGVQAGCTFFQSKQHTSTCFRSLLVSVSTLSLALSTPELSTSTLFSR